MKIKHKLLLSFHIENLYNQKIILPLHKKGINLLKHKTLKNW